MTITNVIFESVLPHEYPDFVSAFISSADIEGLAATEGQLKELNNDRDLIQSLVQVNVTA